MPKCFEDRIPVDCGLEEASTQLYLKTEGRYPRSAEKGRVNYPIMKTVCLLIALQLAQSPASAPTFVAPDHSRPHATAPTITSRPAATTSPATSHEQDIAFTAFDGTTQRYILLPPTNDSAPRDAHATPSNAPGALPRDALIALHGHGSDRWQFVRSDRAECRAARDVAARHRMLFVSPDYRARTSWMGPAAERDLLYIIEQLRTKHGITRIFLCGASMGGSSTLTFTALHPELIAAAVCMNGTANHLEYDQFQDAIAASFGGDKKVIPLEYKRRSAEYWPERFTMPLAITTGGQDTIVPPDSSLRLARVLQHLGKPILVLHRPATGHETSYEDAVQALEYAVSEANRELKRKKLMRR